MILTRVEMFGVVYLFPYMYIKDKIAIVGLGGLNLFLPYLPRTQTDVTNTINERSIIEDSFRESVAIHISTYIIFTTHLTPP